MTIRKVWGSRVDQPVAETYVGQKGTIFFNEPGSGTSTWLRISDGHTVGGIPINVPPASLSTIGGITPGAGFSVNNSGVLSLNAGPMFTVDTNNIYQLQAATTSSLGGIKAGPGVVIASDGSLSLDSTGIPFNFGDFYAFTNLGALDGACLSSIHANQDINIVSNGTGTVNVVGEFNVHTTDNLLEDALAAEPIFRIRSDGQVRILVPIQDSTTGAVEIVGALDGTYQPPVNTGVMLHVTGNPSLGNTATVSRIYNDSQGTYSIYVGRRYNGTATNPQPVLAGQDIARFAGAGYTTDGWPSVGPARMTIKALENLTTSSQGGSIEFAVIPLGSTASNITTATIITSTGTTSLHFYGPLTGNVTGNADTATKLATPRNINGVAFDGTAPINIANTQTLTIGTGLTGSNYNGSAASTIVLNTATLMANAVNATTATSAATAGKVANALTAGYGLKLSSGITYDGSSAITLNKYDSITGPVTVTANAYALDLSTATNTVILDNSSNNMTVTISNPVVGKVVRLMVLNMTGGAGATTVTVSGLTAVNSTNGKASFQPVGNPAVGIVEFICTTTATSGVYMNCSGAK